MASFTAGGQDVICFATTGGKLCGLDLRSNQMVWELTNEAKYGMIILFIELGIEWCVPYRSHEYCVNILVLYPHIECWHGL